MVYFFSCPGLQTVRPQLRLPHIRQRLPDPQVESSLSQNLRRCREFVCLTQKENKTYQMKNPIKSIFLIFTDLVSKPRRLFTLLSTRRRSRRRTRWSRTRSFLRLQKNPSSHWFWANKEHFSLTSFIFYLSCRSRSCMGLEKAVRCFKVISCSVQCLSRRLVDTLHNWHISREFQ